MDFLFKNTGKKAKGLKPEDFSMLNSLPFVLKHSLFIESPVLTKFRTMDDIGELLFMTDDIKIKGNNAYDSGKYYEAIEIYE